MLRRCLFMFLIGAICENVFADHQIFVPHIAIGIADGTSINTSFQLLNLSNQPVTGSITAFTNTGKLFEAFEFAKPVAPGSVPWKLFGLAPLGRASIGTRTTFRSDETGFQAGWALIESTGPIGVVVQFAWRSRGEIIAAASILPDPLTNQFSTPIHVSLLEATGLALVNPSEQSTAEIKLTAYNHEGNVVGETLIALPPRHNMAAFINEAGLFPQLQQLTGSIEVSSTVPVTATVIQSDRNRWTAFRVFPGRIFN